MASSNAQYIMDLVNSDAMKWIVSPDVGQIRIKNNLPQGTLGSVLYDELAIRLLKTATRSGETSVEYDRLCNQVQSDVLNLEMGVNPSDSIARQLLGRVSAMIYLKSAADIRIETEGYTPLGAATRGDSTKIRKLLEEMEELGYITLERNRSPSMYAVGLPTGLDRIIPTQLMIRTLVKTQVDPSEAYRWN